MYTPSGITCLSNVTSFDILRPTANTGGNNLNDSLMHKLMYSSLGRSSLKYNNYTTIITKYTTVISIIPLIVIIQLKLPKYMDVF